MKARMKYWPAGKAVPFTMPRGSWGIADVTSGVKDWPGRIG